MYSGPIIIIGGGLWGSLLAYRMKQCHPDLEFKIYEQPFSLEEDVCWTFSERALETESLKWLAPLISHSWDSHQINFYEFSKQVKGRYFAIFKDELDAKLQKILGPHLKLDENLDLESAIKLGSFVIDTRDGGYYKHKFGYKKSVGFKVELEAPHHYNIPISEAAVPQQDSFRYLKILPLDSCTLFVKDVRKCSHANINQEEIKNDIIAYLGMKNLKIKNLFLEERSIQILPMGKCIQPNYTKVINLTDIFHDVTGEKLPDAVRLIDLLVNTSFRLGELKSVTAEYQNQRKKIRQCYYFLNKVIFNSKNERSYQIHKYLYQLPAPLVEKFHSGKLDLSDIVKSLFLCPQFLPRLLKA